MIKSEPHPGRSGRPAACMQRELGCCGGAFSKQTSAVAATCGCERPPLLEVGCHLIIGHHAEQPSVPIFLLLVAAYEPRKALSHDALFSTTMRTISTFRQHETASKASKNLFSHCPSTSDARQHNLDVTPNGSSPLRPQKAPSSTGRSASKGLRLAAGPLCLLHKCLERGNGAAGYGNSLRLKDTLPLPDNSPIRHVISHETRKSMCYSKIPNCNIHNKM